MKRGKNMHLYRALNKEDEKHYLNNEDILCQIGQKYTSVIDFIIKNHSISPSYYILKHIISNAHNSMWISTSKSFNYVAKEYALIQAGKYNHYMKRKNIAVLNIPDDCYYDFAKEKENLVKRGSYVNLSYANALQSLVNSKDVLPLYIAKDIKGLNLTINEISKIIDYQNKCKINVDGFSNFASESREVLVFSEIKKKYCEVILSPLMQDCLFAVTQKMEDKIREENKTTKLTAEEINQKCEEATNKIIQNFLQIDTNKWQEDILNNNGYDFSITEMNLIHYLYQNNDTLIHLVKSFFENQSGPIRYDIEGFYALLKELKRNILFKITEIKDARMVDDEILVLNKNSTVSDKRKNDVIYKISKDNKLVLNVKKPQF